MLDLASASHVNPLAAATHVLGRRDARGNASVVVRYADGTERPLPMVVDDAGRPESDGFEWGYLGTGPHALAGSLIAFAVEAPARSSTLRELGYRTDDVVRFCVAWLTSEWVLSVRHVADIVSMARRPRVA